jgi:5'-3' exonuclease
VSIWTPDKDLAQCVEGRRVVQVYRRAQKILDADGVRAKFGVDPVLIPDFLALVGDAADGYPGIDGIGPIKAARLLNAYGAIDHFPAPALSPELRTRALIFKRLATLRTDAPLFERAGELRWRGPTADFAGWAERLGDLALLQRAHGAPVI